MNYTSISEILKNTYGQKVYRLSLQSGCSCPNRDGTIGTGGCTFCSEGGSGDFAAPNLSIDEQILSARKRVDQKIPANIPDGKRQYIAYFQGFTNTWGDKKKLMALYAETIHRPEICILSIATRPDAIDKEWISFFAHLNEYKPVWIELGLQTCHDDVAEHFHRGYDTKIFDETYGKLKAAGITVITHIIFGLPGENREESLETVQHVKELYTPFLNDIPDVRSDGVKLQLLHILKDTQLAKEYAEHPFHVLTMDEYISTVVSALEILSTKIVAHRLTGDGPKSLLIAPMWSTDKKRVLNAMNKAIREK